MKFCSIWTRFALVKFRSAFWYASLNSSNVSIISTASAPRRVKNFANSDMVPMIIRTTQWIQYVCTNCAVRNPTGVFQSHGNLWEINSSFTLNKIAIEKCDVYFDKEFFLFSWNFPKKKIGRDCWLNFYRLNECIFIKLWIKIYLRRWKKLLEWFVTQLHYVVLVVRNENTGKYEELSRYHHWIPQIISKHIGNFIGSSVNGTNRRILTSCTIVCTWMNQNGLRKIKIGQN